MTVSSQAHTQFFTIAGMTIQVKSELPINNQTFAQKFNQFKTSKRGNENITLHHHFSLPALLELERGQQVYRQPPWAIYHHEVGWNYLGIAPEEKDQSLWCAAEFNLSHTVGLIYSPNEKQYLQGNLCSLTTFPTDQILLAPVLADREGCYLHASGMIIKNKGLLFVGHSGAGKSTIVSMLRDQGEILCDDRVILRHWPEGFRVHGTWSHGDIPIVSNSSAPLRGILLLEQALVNRLIPFQDRGEIVRRLPFFVIKPLVTSGWWEKTLDLIGHIARDVPIYRLQFDKSGRVKDLIFDLVA